MTNHAIDGNRLAARRAGWLWLTGLLLLSLSTASAQEYLSNEQLARRLKKLAAEQRKLMRLESVAQSLGKHDVWRVELGAGSAEERQRRPAFLLVAGIEGDDLAGTVSAVAWMAHLTEGYEKDAAMRKLLDSTTIHVFPRLNPDAVELCLAKPTKEIAVSSAPGDDDHDGMVDEDGPEDLNGDGQITWMRVQDPDGEYLLDPTEARLLLKADRAKGEKGGWRLLPEGVDNDKDERWSEDGPGGVNFNRNFPYGYRFFAPSAGAHPVSTVETRMLADFVIAHPNIGIVFTFGAGDNLVQTPKSDAGGRRPPTALHDADLPFYRELGKEWRETLGLKRELTGSSEPGTFSDWMYFHRGRLALAAQPWTPALQVELAKGKPKDEGEKAKDAKAAEPPSEKPAAEQKPTARKDAEGRKPEADSRNEQDRAFLKWLDANAPQTFVPWKEVQHPDFPGRKVEVGGFAPLAKTNPPEKLLAELADKHAKFLTSLAGRLPRIGIRKAEAKLLGNAVYEVTVQVENTGYLPSALAQGGLTREVHPTRMVLDLDHAAFLSGARTTMPGLIEGTGGMKEARWVVHAKGVKKIKVEVISMLGGTVHTTIELPGGD